MARQLFMAGVEQQPWSQLSHQASLAPVASKMVEQEVVVEMVTRTGKVP